MVTTLMTVAVVTYVSRKKIDGITGDIIGATNEIAEVIAIVIIVLSEQIWEIC